MVRPGLDGITIETIGKAGGGAEAFLARIDQALVTRPTAQPVRRVCIDKGVGRGLGDSDGRGPGGADGVFPDLGADL